MIHDFSEPTLQIRRLTILGIFSIMLLTIGFGSWATFADLSGAIVVQGRLSAGTDNRDIQHLTGGLITEVSITEGQNVARGAVLLRLDDSRPVAELATINARISEIEARRGRLIAERDGRSSIAFSQSIRDRAPSEPTLNATLQGQVRLFDARRLSARQQSETLRKKAGQVAYLVQGIDAQIAALQTQITLVDEQLTKATVLWEKGLLPTGEILGLRHETAALAGKLGTSRSERAQALVRISEIELEILRADALRRETAIEKLRDLDFRRFELLGQQAAIQKQIGALVLRAPIGGIVLGLESLSEASIIEPSEVVMRIVPQDRAFAIKTRISPNQIVEVFAGQSVRLVFPGGDPINRPQFEGTVSRVSADTLADPITGEPFFDVEVTPNQQSQDAILASSDIIPGMIAEVYFHTGGQPAWSYLAKPFLAYFSKALRES